MAGTSHRPNHILNRRQLKARRNIAPQRFDENAVLHFGLHVESASLYRIDAKSVLLPKKDLVSNRVIKYRRYPTQRLFTLIGYGSSLSSLSFASDNCRIPDINRYLQSSVNVQKPGPTSSVEPRELFRGVRTVVQYITQF